MAARDILGTAERYWQRMRGERALPSRRDLDPTEIPGLLPFVMLIDVEPEPLDFRFRLIGGAVEKIVARDTPRRRFSSIPFMAKGNTVWGHYARVVNERRPLVSDLSYVGNDRSVRRLRHCLMPLSDDGSNVNMIFVAVEIERVGR
jgi:hypothetical protein